MKKDIAEKRLLEHEEVAADILNGTLFAGHSVIKAEQLRLIPREEFSQDEMGVQHERRRDVSYEQRNGECEYAFWGFENQSGNDNTMPLRVVEIDAANYQKQVKAFVQGNRDKGQPAFAATIHKDQKLVPVITTVINYGPPWTGPRELFDMLDLEGREWMRPFLLNYRLNLVELRGDKEYYKRFHSDFRHVAQYLGALGDPEAMEQFRQGKRTVHYIPEFLDLMRAITGDKRYEEVKKQVLQSEIMKEETEMCELLDMVEAKGVEKGIEKGEQLKGIRLIMKHSGHMADKELSDLIEVSVEFIQSIKTLITKNPTLEAEEICELC